MTETFHLSEGCSPAATFDAAEGRWFGVIEMPGRRPFILDGPSYTNSSAARNHAALCLSIIEKHAVDLLLKYGGRQL